MRSRALTVIEISLDQIKIVSSVKRVARSEIAFCNVCGIVGLSDDAVSAKLAEICRKVRGLRKSVVIVQIPLQFASVRFFNLPSSDPVELRQMVEIQVLCQIPYSRAEIVMDFSVISKDVNGYCKVMVVIVQRDIFLRYWKIIENARVSVDRMTLSSVGTSIWSAVVGGDHNSVLAVIDILDDGSEICICQGGRLYMSRQIALGRKELSQGNGKEILRQLELTVARYDKEKIGIPVSRVFLVGPASEPLDQLIQDVRESLRLTAEHVQVLGKVPIVRSNIWPEEVLDSRVSVLSAVGLALGSDTPVVDLIPSDMRALEGKDRTFRMGIKTGISLVVAIILIIVAGCLPLFQRNLNLVSLEKQLKVLNPQVKGVQLKEEQILAVSDFMSRRVIFSDVVSEFYRAVPGDLVLTSMKIFPDGKVVFEGYSANRASVDVLQKNLAQSVLFREVKLEFINKRIIETGEVNYFQTTCRIADNYEKAQ